MYLESRLRMRWGLLALLVVGCSSACSLTKPGVGIERVGSQRVYEQLNAHALNSARPSTAAVEVLPRRSYCWRQLRAGFSYAVRTRWIRDLGGLVLGSGWFEHLGLRRP